MILLTDSSPLALSLQSQTIVSMTYYFEELNMRKPLIAAAIALAASTLMMANNASAAVELHKKPNFHSKVIGTPINVNAPWMVIMYSADKKWAKVANHNNGRVGWINKKGYLHTLKGKVQKTFQAVIVSTQRKNNKVIESVIAYRNGNELSKKEARHLYNKLKKQMSVKHHGVHHGDKMMHDMEKKFFQHPFFHFQPGPDLLVDFPAPSDRPWGQ